MTYIEEDFTRFRDAVLRAIEGAINLDDYERLIILNKIIKDVQLTANLSKDFAPLLGNVIINFNKTYFNDNSQNTVSSNQLNEFFVILEKTIKLRAFK